MTYPIQVVARMTGLSAHVLRVWEKRYGAVVPERTKTHRRRYSEGDVHRLKLLRQATLLGHPISSVAKLAEEALETLMAATGDHPLLPANRSEHEGEETQDSQTVESCLEAVKAFDVEALNNLLEKAAVESGFTAMLHQIVAPLAQRLGDLWADGILRMSHEHFATAAIRGYLLNPSRQYAGATGALVLVAATPQGQLHELGAVMSAALAAEQGWRAVYLGPSLPAAEIAGVAFQHEARAVALSLVYPEGDPNIERELRELRRFLPKKVAIIVGGRAAEHYRPAIDGIGARLVKDLVELRAELEMMGANRTKDV